MPFGVTSAKQGKKISKAQSKKMLLKEKKRGDKNIEIARRVLFLIIFTQTTLMEGLTFILPFVIQSFNKNKNKTKNQFEIKIETWDFNDIGYILGTMYVCAALFNYITYFISSLKTQTKKEKLLLFLQLFTIICGLIGLFLMYFSFYNKNSPFLWFMYGAALIGNTSLSLFLFL